MGDRLTECSSGYQMKIIDEVYQQYPFNTNKRFFNFIVTNFVWKIIGRISTVGQHNKKQ